MSYGGILGLAGNVESIKKELQGITDPVQMLGKSFELQTATQMLTLATEGWTNATKKQTQGFQAVTANVK